MKDLLSRLDAASISALIVSLSHDLRETFAAPAPSRALSWLGDAKRLADVQHVLASLIACIDHVCHQQPPPQQTSSPLLDARVFEELETFFQCTLFPAICSEPAPPSSPSSSPQAPQSWMQLLLRAHAELSLQSAGTGNSNRRAAAAAHDGKPVVAAAEASAGNDAATTTSTGSSAGAATVPFTGALLRPSARQTEQLDSIVKHLIQLIRVSCTAWPALAGPRVVQFIQPALQSYLAACTSVYDLNRQLDGLAQQQAKQQQQQQQNELHTTHFIHADMLCGLVMEILQSPRSVLVCHEFSPTFWHAVQSTCFSLLHVASDRQIRRNIGTIMVRPLMQNAFVLANTLAASDHTIVPSSTNSDSLSFTMLASLWGGICRMSADPSTEVQVDSYAVLCSVYDLFFPSYPESAPLVVDLRREPRFWEIVHAALQHPDYLTQVRGIHLLKRILDSTSRLISAGKNDPLFVLSTPAWTSYFCGDADAFPSQRALLEEFCLLFDSFQEDAVHIVLQVLHRLTALLPRTPSPQHAHTVSTDPIWSVILLKRLFFSENKRVARLALYFFLTLDIPATTITPTLEESLGLASEESQLEKFLQLEEEAKRQVEVILSGEDQDEEYDETLSNIPYFRFSRKRELLEYIQQMKRTAAASGLVGGMHRFPFYANPSSQSTPHLLLSNAPFIQSILMKCVNYVGLFDFSSVHYTSSIVIKRYLCNAVLSLESLPDRQFLLRSILHGLTLDANTLDLISWMETLATCPVVPAAWDAVSFDHFYVLLHTNIFNAPYITRACILSLLLIALARHSGHAFIDGKARLSARRAAGAGSSSGPTSGRPSEALGSAISKPTPGGDYSPPSFDAIVRTLAFVLTDESYRHLDVVMAQVHRWLDSGTSASIQENGSAEHGWFVENVHAELERFFDQSDQSTAGAPTEALILATGELTDFAPAFLEIERSAKTLAVLLSTVSRSGGQSGFMLAPVASGLLSWMDQAKTQRDVSDSAARPTVAVLKTTLLLRSFHDLVGETKFAEWLDAEFAGPSNMTRGEFVCDLAVALSQSISSDGLVQSNLTSFFAVGGLLSLLDVLLSVLSKEPSSQCYDTLRSEHLPRFLRSALAKPLLPPPAQSVGSPQPEAALYTCSMTRFFALMLQHSSKHGAREQLLAHAAGGSPADTASLSSIPSGIIALCLRKPHGASSIAKEWGRLGNQFSRYRFASLRHLIALEEGSETPWIPSAALLDFCHESIDTLDYEGLLSLFECLALLMSRVRDDALTGGAPDPTGAFISVPSAVACLQCAWTTVSEYIKESRRFYELVARFAMVVFHANLMLIPRLHVDLSEGEGQVRGAQAAKAAKGKKKSGGEQVSQGQFLAQQASKMIKSVDGFVWRFFELVTDLAVDRNGFLVAVGEQLYKVWTGAAFQHAETEELAPVKARYLAKLLSFGFIRTANRPYINCDIQSYRYLQILGLTDTLNFDSETVAMAVDSDAEIRAQAIGYLSGLDPSSPSHRAMSRRIIELLLHEDDCLSEQVAKIGGYYPDSDIYLKKLHIWQSVVCLSGFVPEASCTEQLKKVLAVLQRDNHPAIKCYIEWYMELLLLRHPTPANFELLWDILRRVTLSASAISSIFSVCGHVATCVAFDSFLERSTEGGASELAAIAPDALARVPLASDAGAMPMLEAAASPQPQTTLALFVLSKALENIFPWITTHHFTIRLHAQGCLYRILDAMKLYKLPLDTVLSISGERPTHGQPSTGSLIISQVIHYLETSPESVKHGLKLKGDFTFTAFRPVLDFNAALIFFNLPLISLARSVSLMDPKLLVKYWRGPHRRVVLAPVGGPHSNGSFAVVRADGALCPGPAGKSYFSRAAHVPVLESEERQLEYMCTFIAARSSKRMKQFTEKWVKRDTRTASLVSKISSISHSSNSSSSSSSAPDDMDGEELEGEEEDSDAVGEPSRETRSRRDGTDSLAAAAAPEAAKTNVQKKLTPWQSNVRAMTGTDAASPLLQSLLAGGDGGGLAQRTQLIVVASLIDKLPNLGGLARTCEIFKAEALALHDLAVTQEDEFKKLSVTAEKWVPLLHVPVDDIARFLQRKKSEGYTLVGVEQTAEGKKLSSFQFPTRSVLLLGTERHGIPVELINLLDVCVEIPQFGVIRSLNVHVSAALMIWEYARQHLAAQ